MPNCNKIAALLLLAVARTDASGFNSTQIAETAVDVINNNPDALTNTVRYIDGGLPEAEKNELFKIANELPEETLKNLEKLLSSTPYPTAYAPTAPEDTYPPTGFPTPNPTASKTIPPTTPPTPFPTDSPSAPTAPTGRPTPGISTQSPSSSKTANAGMSAAQKVGLASMGVGTLVAFVGAVNHFDTLRKIVKAAPKDLELGNYTTRTSP